SSTLMVHRDFVTFAISPRPTRDSSQIFPPWRSTIFLQIARPIPRSRIVLTRVETLKHLEYTFKILGFNSDSIVLDRKDPVLRFRARRYFNLGLTPVAVLDAIPNQVLEQL